jgi:hypothetical protein
MTTTNCAQPPPLIASISEDGTVGSVDLFREERRIVEQVLALLETVLERLNNGEALANAILGDIVDFFREFEDAAADSTGGAEAHRSLFGYAAQRETGPAFLCDMLGALESLGDGEAGAAGAFVSTSRKYMRVCRERMSASA